MHRQTTALTLLVSALVARSLWRNRPCVACLVSGNGWVRHDYSPTSVS